MKQLKALIILILMVVSASVDTNALTSVVIDNVKYDLLDSGKYCKVTDIVSGVSEATIPASITYKEQTYCVYNVSIATNNDDLQKLIVKGVEGRSFAISINESLFSKCPNLAYFELPFDIESIPVRLLNDSYRLKDLVLPMDKILNVTDLSSSDIWTLENKTVHVPAEMVEVYKDRSQYADALLYQFWNKANIVAIQDEPEPEPEPEPQPEPAKPEGVKLTTPMAHFLLADAVPGHKIHVIPEEGHEISSVMWQGQDGSEFMDENNVFTVPDYTGEGNLNVVMEKAGGISEIESVEADASLRVSVAGRIVKIVGAQFGQAATVTDLSGHVIYSGESREITLPEGVYLLSIAGRTFKFRI